jgi:hypothetical protein
MPIFALCPKKKNLKTDVSITFFFPNKETPEEAVYVLIHVFVSILLHQNPQQAKEAFRTAKNIDLKLKYKISMRQLK